MSSKQKFFQKCEACKFKKETQNKFYEEIKREFDNFVFKMSEFLPGFANLDQFNQEALKSIALATKASNGIPSDRKEDWDFYTTFKSFRQVTDAQSETIRKLIGGIVTQNGIKLSIPRNDSSSSSDILEMLSDFNDQLLERISTNLDEAAGLKKDIDPVLVEITDTRKTDQSRAILLVLSRVSYKL